MERIASAVEESSKGTERTQIVREAAPKYVRYTEEQLIVLEKLYAVSPAPDCFERRKILQDQPILKGIEEKHLKVWFQNRRCREKQKKEADELREENRKLAAANKLLLSENGSLRNKVAQLISENQSLQNQLLSLISTTATLATTIGQGFDAETIGPQPSMAVADTQEETYNGINPLEGDPKMELLMHSEPFHASGHANQLNTPVGPTISPSLNADFVEANQYGGLPMAQEPSFRATTNFTEEYPAMALQFVPNPTFVANSVYLSNLMCQSYRSIFGRDIIGVNVQDNNDYSLFEMVQLHHYAILCFSTSLPVCLYANLSALRMLEATADYSSSLSLDKILLETSDISLTNILSTVMQQGYADLSLGSCKTEANRYAMYEKCVLWRVLAPDGSVQSIAAAFINWFVV